MEEKKRSKREKKRSTPSVRPILVSTTPKKEPRLVFHQQPGLSPFTVRLHREEKKKSEIPARIHSTCLLEEHDQRCSHEAALQITLEDLRVQLSELPQITVVATPQDPPSSLLFDLPEEESEPEEDESPIVEFHNGSMILATEERSPFIQIHRTPQTFFVRGMFAFAVLSFLAILPIGSAALPSIFSDRTTTAQAAATTLTPLTTEIAVAAKTISRNTIPACTSLSPELRAATQQLADWGVNGTFHEAITGFQMHAERFVAASAAADHRCPPLHSIEKHLGRIASQLAALDLVFNDDYFADTLLLTTDPEIPRPGGGIITQSERIVAKKGRLDLVHTPLSLRLGYLPPPPLQSGTEEWRLEDLNWFIDRSTNSRILLELLQDESIKQIVMVNSEQRTAFETALTESFWNTETFLTEFAWWGEQATERTWSGYHSENEKQSMFVTAGFAGTLPKEADDLLMIGRLRVLPDGQPLTQQQAIDAEEHLSTRLLEDGTVEHTLTLTYRPHLLKEARLLQNELTAYEYTKILLPASVEITASSGFTTHPTGVLSEEKQSVHKEVFYEWEDRKQVSGVERFTEQGQVVVGGWIDLIQGKTATASLTYRLPNMIKTKQEGSRELISTLLRVPTPIHYTFWWPSSREVGVRRTHTLETIPTWTIHETTGPSNESSGNTFWGWVFDRAS